MYAGLVYNKEGGPPVVHDPSYSHFNGNGATGAEEYSSLDNGRGKEGGISLKCRTEYARLDHVWFFRRCTKGTVL